jgi:hypothetical protein
MTMPDDYRSEDIMEVTYCPMSEDAKCNPQCQWWDVTANCCVVECIDATLGQIAKYLSYLVVEARRKH